MKFLIILALMTHYLPLWINTVRSHGLFDHKTKYFAFQCFLWCFLQHINLSGFSKKVKNF